MVIIQTSKFYEVQKHLALTGHFYAPAALLIGQRFFNSLTPEQQQAIQEAAIEATRLGAPVLYRSRGQPCGGAEGSRDGGNLPRFGCL